MTKSFGLLLYSLLTLIGFVLSAGSVLDDPASWPGHLQPLGTGRPITKVAEFNGFPEPDGNEDTWQFI